MVSDDESDDSKLVFFHGKLRIHIISAENLPDTDTAFFNIDNKDVTDPYVTGDLGFARLFKVQFRITDLSGKRNIMCQSSLENKATLYNFL